MRFCLIIFGLSLISITYGQNPIEKVRLYPLSKVIGSCTSSPDRVYSTRHYIYSENKLLIQTIGYTSRTESDTIIRDYYYNDLGQLSAIKSTTLIGMMGIDDFFERTKIFKYDQDGNLIYSGYDDQRPNNLIAKYCYSNEGRLIKSIDSCNSNTSEYTYIYDKLGRLKEEYKNEILIKKYKYNNKNQLRVLIEYSPIRYSKRRFFLRLTHLRYKYEYRAKFRTFYKYDNQGRLFEKTKEDWLLERNIYENDFLVERQSNEFGTDLCFYPCCGSMIYRYEYFE